MFARLMKHVASRTGRSGSASRADLTARGRWENEGGAGPEVPVAETAVAVVPAEQEVPAAAVPSAVDVRQDKIMTLTSSDGRPPSRWQRMTGWRWLGVGAILLVAGVATWMAVKGVSLGAVAVGAALGVLLLVSASPVLWAGLMRGQEQRTARKIARSERRGGRRPR